MVFRTGSAASEAYWRTQVPVSALASACTLKRAKQFRDAVDAGLTIEEASNKVGIRNKETAMHYMYLSSRTVSMDATEDGLRGLHETLPSLEEVTVATRLEDALQGFTELEQFVVKAYIRNIGRKDWKKATLKECTEWGISKKQAMKILSKIRNKT